MSETSCHPREMIEKLKNTPIIKFEETKAAIQKDLSDNFVHEQLEFLTLVKILINFLPETEDELLEFVNGLKGFLNGLDNLVANMNTKVEGMVKLSDFSLKYILKPIIIVLMATQSRNYFKNKDSKRLYVENKDLKVLIDILQTGIDKSQNLFDEKGLNGYLDAKSVLRELQKKFESIHDRQELFIKRLEKVGM